MMDHPLFKSATTYVSPEGESPEDTYFFYRGTSLSELQKIFKGEDKELGAYWGEDFEYSSDFANGYEGGGEGAVMVANRRTDGKGRWLLPDPRDIVAILEPHTTRVLWERSGGFKDPAFAAKFAAATSQVSTMLHPFEEELLKLASHDEGMFTSGDLVKRGCRWLYHGTSSEFIEQIKKDGLKGERVYVTVVPSIAKDEASYTVYGEIGDAPAGGSGVVAIIDAAKIDLDWYSDPEYARGEVIPDDADVNSPLPDAFWTDQSIPANAIVDVITSSNEFNRYTNKYASHNKTASHKVTPLEENEFQDPNGDDPNTGEGTNSYSVIPEEQAGVYEKTPIEKAFLGSTDESDDEIERYYSEKYPVAGPVVDGRQVNDNVTNMSSIAATFPNYLILDGIREVNFDLFDMPPDVTKRIKALAQAIEQSGIIEALIVGEDGGGPFIVEGSHRYDALKILGAKAIPAIVALDLDELRENKEKQASGMGIELSTEAFTPGVGWPIENPKVTPDDEWDEDGEIEPKRAKAGPHSIGSTQINLPETAAQEIMEAAESIPDTELAEDGREDQPHVTIKFGIEEDRTALEEAVKNQKSFMVTLGKLHVFPTETQGQKAVVAEAHARELSVLHKLVEEAIGAKPDKYSYKPHVTIAYVKPEFANKYEGSGLVTGVNFYAEGITLSHASGNQEFVPLAEQAMAMHAATLSGPQQLEKKLMSIADLPILGEQIENDPDAAEIARRGRAYKKRVEIPGAMGNDSECHWNTAKLYQQGLIDAIAIGYGLNDEGWHQHTWGLRNGMVVETTRENLGNKIWFGLPLTAEQSKKFAEFVTQQRPGAGMVRTTRGGSPHNQQPPKYEQVLNEIGYNYDAGESNRCDWPNGIGRMYWKDEDGSPSIYVDPDNTVIIEEEGGGQSKTLKQPTPQQLKKQLQLFPKSAGVRFQVIKSARCVACESGECIEHGR